MHYKPSANLLNSVGTLTNSVLKRFYLKLGKFPKKYFCFLAFFFFFDVVELNYSYGWAVLSVCRKICTVQLMTTRSFNKLHHWLCMVHRLLADILIRFLCTFFPLIFVMIEKIFFIFRKKKEGKIVGFFSVLFFFVLLWKLQKFMKYFFFF